MSKFLFRLNDVPDDESEEIRQLLRDHSIAFYETDAGRWGFSTAAIWLKDPTQFGLARSLIERYQQERSTKMRAEYARLKEEGELDTLWRRLKRHPVQILFLIFAAALILYLSIKPFLTINS